MDKSEKRANALQERLILNKAALDGIGQALSDFQERILQWQHHKYFKRLKAYGATAEKTLNDAHYLLSGAIVMVNYRGDNIPDTLEKLIGELVHLTTAIDNTIACITAEDEQRFMEVVNEAANAVQGSVSNIAAGELEEANPKTEHADITPEDIADTRPPPPSEV